MTANHNSIELTRALESAKSSLRQILGALSEEDRYIAEDVAAIFLSTRGDQEYGVEGLVGGAYIQPGFQVRYSDAHQIYTLLILNQPEISMRSMMNKLMNHDSVYDVIIDNDARPDGGLNLTVQIQIWKSAVKVKTLKTYEVHKDLSADDNMNGLIMSRNSKKDARDIIEAVINMERPDMWEPNWVNKVGADGKSYLLIAKPIRRVHLSFYRHLCGVSPVIMNTLLTPAITDGTVRCVSMSLHCKMRPDDDSDSDGEEEEVAPVKAKTPKKPRKMGISKLPIAKPNASKSWLGKLAAGLSFTK